MPKNSNVLGETLTLIEAHLKEEMDSEKLAKKLHLSEGHLRRLFKKEFDISLASYIRSRKLAHSLELLQDLRLSVLEVALQSGFSYAQPYIRAFKSEYGMTPSAMWESGQVVKVTPPLRLNETNPAKSSNSFGPEIVYVTGFDLIGKTHRIPEEAPASVPASLAYDFYFKERGKFEAFKHKNVYFGLTYLVEEDYSLYTTSFLYEGERVPASHYKKIYVPSGTYVKFQYIGHHDAKNLNANAMKGMYEAIRDFEESQGVFHKSLGHNKRGYYFEKITQDGASVKVEWFSPVFEK